MSNGDLIWGFESRRVGGRHQTEPKHDSETQGVAEAIRRRVAKMRTYDRYADANVVFHDRDLVSANVFHWNNEAKRRKRPTGPCPPTVDVRHFVRFLDLFSVGQGRVVRRSARGSDFKVQVRCFPPFAFSLSLFVGPSAGLPAWLFQRPSLVDAPCSYSAKQPSSPWSVRPLVAV